jgi:hypothetical protein
LPLCVDFYYFATFSFLAHPLASQMHFSHDKLSSILADFGEEHSMGQLKCCKDTQAMLLNLLQTYHFIIADNNRCD